MIIRQRGVRVFDNLTDTPATKEASKFVKVNAGATALEYSDPGDVSGPASTTENKVPQWSATSKTLKDGLTVNTTVNDPGLDTELVTGKAVRDAIDTLGDKTIKATYFATVASGTTSGTITKPAGTNATLVMDEWGTDTDALVSTMENGKPTFESPVAAGGTVITTTFNTAGEYVFSDTPSPAADHALIYVYTCKLSDFLSSESLFETELVPVLVAGDIPDLSATYAALDADVDFNSITIDGDIDTEDQEYTLYDVKDDNDTVIAKLTGVFDNLGAGTQNGVLRFYVIRAGVLTNVLELDGE
jgi:hypothetical protein